MIAKVCLSLQRQIKDCCNDAWTPDAHSSKQSLGNSDSHYLGFYKLMMRVSLTACVSLKGICYVLLPF